MRGSPKGRIFPKPDAHERQAHAPNAQAVLCGGRSCLAVNLTCCSFGSLQHRPSVVSFCTHDQAHTASLCVFTQLSTFHRRRPADFFTWYSPWYFRLFYCPRINIYDQVIWSANVQGYVQHLVRLVSLSSSLGFSVRIYAWNLKNPIQSSPEVWWSEPSNLVQVIKPKIFFLPMSCVQCLQMENRQWNRSDTTWRIGTWVPVILANVFRQPIPDGLSLENTEYH